MPEREKTLGHYFAQLRRIEAHREAGAEREIRRLYQQLLRELREFLGVQYARYAQDDRLTYAQLQQQGAYARFLEEVEQRVNDLTPQAAGEIRRTVDEAYRAAYNGMTEAVQKASDTAALREALRGLTAATPDVVRRAVENPVAGLTLKDTLEKNRREVIYDIKRQIGVGLMNGDRMSTMARRIQQSVDMDYRKAMTIARTEVHRVREAGHHDAAARADGELRAAGLRTMKTWKTMQDERVRPKRGIGKKKARRGANHVKMEGVTLPVDAYFDLGHGVKALEPGASGDPGNDINCRCYLSYSIEPIGDAGPVANSRESGIMREVNLEPLPVTDEAIERVPAVESTILPPDKAIVLREKHQELLRFVRSMKPGTEALVQYDMQLKRIGASTGKPGQARVRERGASVPYIAIHNHPSGNGFTLNDVLRFSKQKNMRVLTAVGHNGKVYKIEKQSNFDEAGFMLYFLEQTQDVKLGSPEEHLALVEKVLKGAGMYGVRFDR